MMYFLLPVHAWLLAVLWYLTSCAHHFLYCSLITVSARYNSMCIVLVYGILS